MLPILLLHGALGSAQQLQPLYDNLSHPGDVHTIEFSSHGNTPSQEGFGIEAFADEVLVFMNRYNLPQVNIFGYSMGGYVALYLARHYPDKIASVVTLATKLHWDAPGAAKEVGGLNPEKISQKVPQFAAALEARHQALPWQDLMGRTADMMLAMGAKPPLAEEDYKAINTPVRLLLGDRDKMVTLEETNTVFFHLPKAELGILPGTPHPLEAVDIALLTTLVSSFFTKSSH